MTEPTTRRESPLARFIGPIAIAVLLVGAAIVSLRFGPPAVVLWFAFAALAGGILLFWESLRALMDPNAPGDEMAVEGRDRNPSDLEDRKRAALQALRDIEFEHSIRRISDQDYAALKEQYRAEARAAMEAMDKGLGPYLARAEELIARAGSPGGAKKTETGEAANTRRKKGSARSTPATASTSDAAAETNEAVIMPQLSSSPESDAGTKNEAADDEPAEKSTDASVSSAMCPSCDTRNDADAAFCKRCGTKIASVT